MRKLLLLLIVLLVPASLFAQDEGWRNRRPGSYGRGYTVDNSFELTPFLGYRYGGTIYANQTALFNQDVDVASALNYGVNFGIPVGNGWKVELLVDRQDTNFTAGGGGLFSPNNDIAGFHVTYFQGGLQIPFAVSRVATPYVSFGAGVANLDPDVRGVSTDTRFAAHGGIGIKVPVNRNVGFKLEERGFFTSLGNSSKSNRGFYTYNHDLYQGETNFGVYLRF